MIRTEDKNGVPFYIVEAGEEVKLENIKEGFAYVATSEGILMKRTNVLYSGFFKTTGKYTGKADVKVTYRSDFILPYEFFASIEAFFQKVYDTYKTEAAILLYYNFDEKKWAYCVPTQTVSAASADYEVDKDSVYVFESDLGKTEKTIPSSYMQVGSIHSHASMSAFHSGTDDKDEFDFDGLHITIGNFNGNHTYSCRFIFAGTEFKKELKEVVDIKRGRFPEEAMDCVSEYKAPATKTYNTWGTWQGSGYWDGGAYVSGKEWREDGNNNHVIDTEEVEKDTIFLTNKDK